MGKIPPNTTEWLREAKQLECAGKIGMYLMHNGVVRGTARAMARSGDMSAPPVTGMEFSYDQALVEEAVRETYRLSGVYHVRVWLNEGRLSLGEDIMYVLIGGDIRPNVIAALDFLVSRLKNTCVGEKEIYS